MNELSINILSIECIVLNWITERVLKKTQWHGLILEYVTLDSLTCVYTPQIMYFIVSRSPLCPIVECLRALCLNMYTRSENDVEPESPLLTVYWICELSVLFICPLLSLCRFFREKKSINISVKDRKTMAKNDKCQILNQLHHGNWSWLWSPTLVEKNASVRIIKVHRGCVNVTHNALLAKSSLTLISSLSRAEQKVMNMDF